MAELGLRRGEIQPADLPAVCAKTGAPATETVRTMARRRVDGATWRMALVIPYFFAAAHRVEQFGVDLPAAAAVGTRLRRTTYVAKTTSLASIMVMVVGTVTVSVPILLGGVLVGVVSLAAGFATERAWVDVTLVDDDVVVLRRIHPAFARTVAMRGTGSSRRLRSPG